MVSNIVIVALCVVFFIIFIKCFKDIFFILYLSILVLLLNIFFIKVYVLVIIVLLYGGI